MSAVLLLCAAACTQGSAPATSGGVVTPPPAGPEVTGAVTEVFTTYRVGVAQGDGGAVVGALTEDSLADMARVADLARTAGEEEVRALPAAEQLLVLTYRLLPELLDAEEPYRALAGAGLAGQDRPIGDLGEVLVDGDARALGVVVDARTGSETPLRWRFAEEADGWRFDLVHAHSLLNQIILSAADAADIGVDELVAATVSDLSGEDREVIEALYAEGAR